MSRLLFVCDTIIVLIFIWRYRFIPDEIPLFYSRPWGDDQLVEYWYILLIPALMHIFYMINIILNKQFFKHDAIMSKLLTSLNVIIIILFTGIFLRIFVLIT